MKKNSPADILPFSEIWQPVINQALEDTRRRLGAASGLLLEPAWQSLAAALARRVSSIVAPGLLIEFKVWRALANPGRMPDAHSDRLWLAWLEEKAAAGLPAALGLQPAGKKLLDLIIGQWQAVVVEMVRRLQADTPRLRRYFGLIPASVAEIQADASDYHDGGRAVMIVTFTSGARLVYKPRCLRLEREWTRFLGWVNRQGAPHGLPALRRLRILAGTGYGWMEYAAMSPCGSPEEAARFSQRCGTLLALWTLVGGTDLHVENLGACGEHPVLLDAETMFDFTFSTSDDPARWICSTGMLPPPAAPPGEFRYEALSRWEEQDFPSSAWQWEQVGTDAIRQVQKTRTLTNPLAPFWHGTPAQWWQDLEKEITAGMHDTLELLSKHAPEVEGWLTRLAAHPGRIILRPTSHYGIFLRELLARLPSWREADVTGLLAAMPPAPAPWEAWRQVELDALARLDVPRLLRPEKPDHRRRLALLTCHLAWSG